jgi:F-type H+-transporting ATPase subunit delta
MQPKKQTRREARQLFRLCFTDGVLDEGRAERLLHRVLQEKPRGWYPVVSHFQHLLKLEYVRRTDKVETAAPLSPGAAAGIQARLTDAYGPGLRFSFLHTPALIGGMRVTVGSDIYDGSVHGRLAALEDRL